jgi:hypothetical protein
MTKLGDSVLEGFRQAVEPRDELSRAERVRIFLMPAVVQMSPITRLLIVTTDRLLVSHLVVSKQAKRLCPRSTVWVGASEVYQQ